MSSAHHGGLTRELERRAGLAVCVRAVGALCALSGDRRGVKLVGVLGGVDSTAGIHVSTLYQPKRSRDHSPSWLSNVALGDLQRLGGVVPCPCEGETSRLLCVAALAGVACRNLSALGALDRGSSATVDVVRLGERERDLGIVGGARCGSGNLESAELETLAGHGRAVGACVAAGAARRSPAAGAGGVGRRLIAVGLRLDSWAGGIVGVCHGQSSGQDGKG